MRVLLAAGEGGDDTVVKGRPNTENGTDVAAVGTHVFSFSDFCTSSLLICVSYYDVSIPRQLHMPWL